MALTTYAELKTSIADWLLRSDLTSVIPDFITLTEADMTRRLRHWRMESRTTLSVSGQFTNLPTGFIEATKVSLSDTTARRMESISRAAMQELREKDEDTAGKPDYYALTGGQLEVWPTPDDTYSVDFAYMKFDVLSDSNTSNWVLANHSDAYLYGALWQAHAYLMDYERAARWLAKYDAVIENINDDSKRADFGDNPRVPIRSY